MPLIEVEGFDIFSKDKQRALLAACVELCARYDQVPAKTRLHFKVPNNDTRYERKWYRVRQAVPVPFKR